MPAGRHATVSGFVAAVAGSMSLGATAVRARRPSATVALPATRGWQPDPTGRHALRFHDGTQWTKHVWDDGAFTRDGRGAALLG
jgi:hypothetical protein